MNRQELKEKCSNIVELIDETNNSNVYDNIITFFQLTSELHDKLEEIQEIPIKQKDPSIWMRLFNRKKAKQIDGKLGELGRQKLGLCQTISNCGRSSYGYNRTNVGEQITKNNVYFGGIFGLNTLPVVKWEECREPKVAIQMTSFMKSHKAGFELTNWF